MGTYRRLSATDRRFFSLVGRAVCTNPFSDERALIDAEIGGGSPREASAQRRARVHHKFHQRLQKLDASGGAKLNLYAGDDKETLTFAFLFEVYYRHFEDLDRLIEKEMVAGDAPCAVSFAPRVLEDLRTRGFEPDAVCRHLALFYQLRRAFYFIDCALVGQSPSMKALRRSLWNNIFTDDIRWYDRYLWNRMEDFSTLLLGDTGTGKGSAAAAIGRSGFIPFDPKRGRFVESFTRAFVPLNLSQFPESLVESELFGHRKGAFTGAVEDHDGIFSVCSPHGSIFLDEIGEVSVPLQIKLLQVLQERVFSPVGSHETRRFRGRVIAATNRSLADLRGKGAFRDDFFYRLCSDVIVVPSLRQRLAEDPGELELMVRHTVGRTLGEGSEEMAGMVLDVIRRELGPDYPWPGNVRELEQCVRRVLLKRHYEGDLRKGAADALRNLVEKVGAGSMDAQGLLASCCALLYERHGSYEAVARLLNLDRRTVKKYVGIQRSS
jgi:DNA-binding NtrC family response regulator